MKTACVRLLAKAELKTEIPIETDRQGNIHSFAVRYYNYLRRGDPRPVGVVHLLHNLSRDGGKPWIKPTPTQFQAANAPGGISRLSDGHIALSWNDLSQYPAVLHSGRQYLHIAISSDEGKTWSRSKLIEQRRQGEHPHTNVRCPFLCETEDKQLLMKYSRVSADGRGSEMLRIDPNWIAR